MRNYRIYLTATICTLLLCQCANRGSGPQGGPKDETPPIVIKSNPANGSVNFSGNTITIDFNENISVDNPTQNVVMSPPTKNKPTVKALGHKLIVSFQDTLQPDATYSLNFGNSIVDYNESNPLRGYRFLFATGPTLDSLRIEGRVVDAETLSPLEKITVGIYAHETDSTFATKTFDYVAVTDKNGQFCIDGVHEGTYSIYALNDLQGLYHYSQPGQFVAFCDSAITPTVQTDIKSDTIWADTTRTSIDSVITHRHTVFGPDNIELRAFKELTLAQKFSRSSRETRERFNLLFTDPVSELPDITLLDTTVTTPWYAIEKTAKRDSLLYWITDSALVACDTLRLSIRYPSIDDEEVPIMRCDTIRLTFRKKKSQGSSSSLKSKSSQKNPTENKAVTYLTFSHTLQKAVDYFDSIRFTFDEPIVIPDTSAVHLSIQVNDSTWNPIGYQMQVDNPDCPLKLLVTLNDKPDPTAIYKVQIDSMGIHSIYGKGTDRFSKPFQFTKEEDYANLFVKVVPRPDNAILELLSDKGEVLETQPLTEDEVAFYDKIPGNYKVRMYLDANGNGKWDTGSVKDRRQAETMYNCPKTFNLRANWDVEETWEYQTTSKSSETDNHADKLKKLK